MGSSHSKNATFDVQALKTRRVAFEQPSVVASCAKVLLVLLFFFVPQSFFFFVDFRDAL